MTGWTLHLPSYLRKSSKKNKHKHSHSAPEPSVPSGSPLSNQQRQSLQVLSAVQESGPTVQPLSIPTLSLPSPSITSSSLPSPSPSPSTAPPCFQMATPGAGRSTAASSLHVPESQQPSRSPSPVVNPNYRTVDFDEGLIDGLKPEEYYGSFLDKEGKPTEIFKRIVDALFEWMDKNYDNELFNCTGQIEPEKYGWMLSRKGTPKQAVDLIINNIHSYYDAGKIPYTLQPSGPPILDRKAWLHLQVFEAKATPESAHRFWESAVRNIELCDGGTQQRYPSPLPRSAFPATANPDVAESYKKWRNKVTYQRRKAEEAAIQASNAQTVDFMYTQLGMPLSAGFLPPQTNAMPMSGPGWGGRPQPGGSSSGDTDRTTAALDAASAMINLVSTAVGASTGNSGGGNGGNSGPSGSGGPGMQYGPYGGNPGFGNGWGNGFGTSSPGFGFSSYGS